MKILSVVLLAAAVAGAEVSPKAPPEGGSRAARFANPPASARILPLHHGRPNNRKANDAELKTLMLDGFGGMASNVSFGIVLLPVVGPSVVERQDAG